MEKDYTYKNFGYKKVPLDEKEGMVKDLFSQVSTKYDLMNNLMSFGIHNIWKDTLISNIHNLNGKLLDVAGGTGDIAFRLYKKAIKSNIVPNITIADINPEMLKIAKDKAINNNMLFEIDFVECNAEKLPFDDNSFDYYTISFGIRNVTNIDLVLQEAYRVLKPFGKFICLEFSKINNSLLETLYKAYSFNIVPIIGKIIASNQEAYKYLVESIDLFPDQNTFRSMIEAEGFKNVKYQNLSLGIASIHTAYKI
jgi:demethylmenaquinone methyltransferase/2-methoxy-6-polyprenyl-1,4-benzoquinol methylase